MIAADRSLDTSASFLARGNERLEASSVERAASGPRAVSQHKDGTIRYSKREIIRIYKGLGRFISPLEFPEMHEIDVERVGKLLKE